jgi:hypothetical protein
MPQLSSSTIQGLRYCCSSEYAGLSGADLKRIIESSISGLPSDTAEDFLGSLSSFGKTVAPALQRAAPDVAQGAAAGSTLGPWGAVIGAGAGLASSLTKSQVKPAPAPAASPPATTIPAPTGPPPTGVQGSAPPALPTGQGAAATLLSLLQNPTIQQALLSQVLGSSGSRQVQTASGTNVPTGAINALLTQLLANASEALPESEPVSESYLQDAAGQYLIDPASFDQHAALVLSYLQRKPSLEESPEAVEWEVEAVPAEFSEEWPEVDESFVATFY